MYKALIIDDIPSNVTLLTSFLRLYGVQSIEAYTGKEGFDLACQHQPDIILIDLLMPKISWDGYQTIQQLRDDQRTNHIPIIVITAVGDEAAAFDAGCDDLLSRPFQTGALLEILQRHVDKPLIKT